ncbi:uncharacterized protein F4817DRAFT_312008 [Daldinia loculata]|uniref:uncharacterized protein n=1 Tax=Daldinia loculata TaxID=103429 RepID=UPI0020C34C26|nr:uncharacterized protein F4817DRAFT_312008 [Daldinia loculata]KAI1651179.1 hypothetical protein F4817DRAFT_312008 [Daldinia loculata]
MDPVLSELKVPCVREYERDTGPFRTYPDKHRIDLTALELDTPDSLTEFQFTLHLQNWLCFGLIGEICQVCLVLFHPSDLVIEERGNQIISYAQLEQYIWYWCGAGHTIAEKKWVTARAEFCELLYTANKVSSITTTFLYPDGDHDYNQVGTLSDYGSPIVEF